ncbi:FadR/GntR family transcriptional regulator [Azospirillum sp. TSO22-1]|uniref:FadR/GntR family transcriptional regulator n=1 Tax=Azospirillum sp. TSO22-1 TaxID=716789 RepID=UPI000D61E87C|nr:FadR/GntR family transcriptional regulator [Azospirillum sp. TSO22-1]PWC43446.1 hypothetical protein TSO221_19860 [Azospirillum sp. TSO22-1]
MPFQAIESQRLYQQIAGQIGALIRRGEFAPGDRLPPERDLARSLGVSRPVLREAMVALEIAGLVEVRTGSGIYVQPPQDSEAPPDPTQNPLDLIRARRMIEGEIAAAAAGNATAEDLAGIAGAMAMIEAAVADGRDTLQSDRLFHVRIAAATGNPVLVSVIEELWARMMAAPVFVTLRRRTGLTDYEPSMVTDHSRILDALRRRDPAAARDAMHAHLAQVEEVMLCGDSSG